MKNRPFPFNFGVRDDRIFLGLLLLMILGTLPAWAAAPAAPAFLRSFARSDRALVVLWDDNSTDETAFLMDASENGVPTQFSFPTSSTPGTDADGRIFSSLGAGYNYTFTVRALKGTEASAPSNTISINFGDFNAPSSLLAVPWGEGAFIVIWCDNAFYESGHALEYRELPNGNWVQDGVSGADNTAVFLDHSPWMIPSRSYQFRIRGFKGTHTNPTAWTAYSAVATAALSPLAAPDSLTGTPSPANPGQISFSWADKSTMEHGYELEYRKQNLASPQPFTLLRSTWNDVTGIADLAEFELGTVYEFRVRAVFYASETETIGSAYYPASGGIAVTTPDGINSKPCASALAGLPFQYQLKTQSRNARTGWSAGPLPAGLSFSAQTGVISGVLQEPGVYNIPTTATFSGGRTHTQTLTVRAIRPPGAPKIDAVIPAQALTQSGTVTLWLGSAFSDPDTERAVRMHTSGGNLDFILYASATPQTVANFLRYAGDFAYSLFHRSLPGFILQGGGYYYHPEYDVFEHLAADAPVTNEPGISNTFGTVAMAKVADQPNSATSEFFINLADNAGNLDNQNSGFTVFGRLSSPSLSGALAALTAVKTYTWDVYLYDAYMGDTYPQTWHDLPIDGGGMIPYVESVEEIPPLAYSILTPPNDAVATAALSGSSLQIRAVAPGFTQVTVAATDLDGNTTTQTVDITVRTTLAEWAAQQGLPSSDPTARRPGGLTNLQAFAFMEDPSHGVPAWLPTFALKASDAPPRAKITFPVRKYAAGLTYIVEASSTLGSNDWTPLWSSAGELGYSNVSAAEDQRDRTLITVADSQPASVAPRRFLRVKLVAP